MKIDDLIEELTEVRNRSGNSDIFIKDTDTGYHMAINGVRESNNEAGKMLIVTEDYSDYFSRDDK